MAGSPSEGLNYGTSDVLHVKQVEDPFQSEPGTHNRDLAETDADRTAGLPKPSVVNVSQLITVDRRFLTGKLRVLSKEYMDQIEEGLRLVLKL
jgi:hypothetical protein